MSDNFEGMSLKEMRGMPMTADATGLQLARLFPTSKLNMEKWNEGLVEVATTQAAYVQSVYDRCPNWRRWKKAKLARALDHARRVERMALFAAGRDRA